jgi:hypothetical protein
MIHGHDAVSVLRIGLGGPLKGAVTDEVGLLATLRLAYTHEILEATALYRDIALWQVVTNSKVLL